MSGGQHEAAALDDDISGVRHASYQLGRKLERAADFRRSANRDHQPEPGVSGPRSSDQR